MGMRIAHGNRNATAISWVMQTPSSTGASVKVSCAVRNHGERTRLNRRTRGAAISSTRNSCVIPDGAVVCTIEPTRSGGGETRSARATLRSQRAALLSFERNAQALSRSLFTRTEDVICISVGRPIVDERLRLAPLLQCGGEAIDLGLAVADRFQDHR